MGLRISTAAAFSAGVLVLSACGGDSDGPEVEEAPSQTSAAEPETAVETATETSAETAVEPEPDVASETSAAPEANAGDSPMADLLLTDDEFPLDGFTRGEVTDEAGSDAAADGTTEGALDELTAGQDLSPECEEALKSTDVGESDVADGSSVDFTGPTGSSPVPTSISLVVAPYEGESPLTAMSKVSSKCDSFTIEEGGQSVEMSFNELDELEGTEIAVDMSGFAFKLIFGGEANDDVVVLAVGTGVDEADVAKVVKAQFEKVETAG